MIHPSFNFVVFGEVGVGKSSVVNLIAGKKVAETSADSWGCSLESKQYTFQVARRTFNVWDTVGLEEPIFSARSHLYVIEKMYSLIQQITTEGGLDLLLFCIPRNGSRISQTMLCNYRLFFEVLCEKRIPIALVVTHLEAETKMDDWWVRNVHYINNCGLKFSGHACVTGLPGDRKEREGRGALEHLLLGYDHERRYTMPSASDWHLGFRTRFAACFIPAKDKRKQLEVMLPNHRMMDRDHRERYLMPPASDWFSGFLERLPSIARSKTLKDKQKEPEPSLRNRRMMDSTDAQGLTETPVRHARNSSLSTKSKSHSGMRSSFNIILFGEAGIGKSSVINLIAEKDVAKTSGDAWGCTLQSKRYTFPVAKRTFNIWDTIGLGEASFSVTNYLGAIEKTYTLIRQIEAEGGLDLLLFCIPGNGSRITQTMLCNYRLFFEVFCEKRIPISVVVTRLEGEVKMDEWWDRNGEYISQSGLKFGGHACVTGQREHPKAAEGRAALELLLLSYDPKGRYPMPPASTWFAGFLKRLPILPRSKELKDKRQEVERLLRDRCMMDTADAQQLAETLTRPQP